MKKKLISIIALLASFSSFAQESANATFIVRCPNKVEDYLNPNDEKAPLLGFRGFEVKNDSIYLYTQTFKTGFIMPKGPGLKVAMGYHMIPTLAISKVGLNMTNPQTVSYYTNLIDAWGKPEDYAYSIGDDSRTHEEYTDNTKSPRLSQLKQLYPLAYQTQRTGYSQTKTADFVAFTWNPTFMTSTYTAKDYALNNQIPLITKTDVQNNCKADFAPNKEMTWRCELDTLNRRGFAVMSERGDKTLKNSEYLRFHYVLYDKNGTVLSDVKKEYPFIKGVTFLKAVYDIEKKQNCGFLVVLNNNPVMGMKKYKDPEENKHEVLFFDASGKLVYETSFTSVEKQYPTPMYTFKKGDDVYMISRVGNFVESSIVLSKINASGMAYEADVNKTVVGNKESRMQTGSLGDDYYKALGCTIFGNNLIVYGNQIKKVDVPAPATAPGQMSFPQKETRYISFNIIEINMSTMKLMNEYAIKIDEANQKSPSAIEAVYENAGNYYFLTSQFSGERRVQKIDTKNNSQPLSCDMFTLERMNTPQIMFTRKTETGILKPTVPNFRTVYPQNSWIKKGNTLYFIGYLEDGKQNEITYKVLSFNL